MSIDLLNLEPTIVTRDLKGKLVLFYGEPKSGKTSNAVKFPKSLLLAFEKGYNALNNVMAQPINKWSEFKQVLKQLKDSRVKEKFETIIIDTADIAWDLCENYILNREGVDKVSEIPYGQGWGMIEKEFDETLRSIPLMDYGLVLISHAEDKEFTDEEGITYQKIVPTLPKRAKKVVSRMVDIIAYSRTVQDKETGDISVNLYLRGTPRFEAGSRWKHTPNVIPFKYENLVNVLADAIEKQAEEDGVTASTEHINIFQETETISFDQVMNEINDLLTKIMNKSEDNASKITKVIEKHLGKGRKVSEANEEQLEMLILILDDLKDLLNE